MLGGLWKQTRLLASTEHKHVLMFHGKLLDPVSVETSAALRIITDRNISGSQKVSFLGATTRL